MSSDISRQRFNPTNDFKNVLMQQGRVQLDAEWNEWNEILDRRWRSETIDIIGRCVVPLENAGRIRDSNEWRQPDYRPWSHLRPRFEGGEPWRGRGDWSSIPFWPSRVALSRWCTKSSPMTDPGAPEQAGRFWCTSMSGSARSPPSKVPASLKRRSAVDTTSRLQTAWQVRVLA